MALQYHHLKDATAKQLTALLCLFLALPVTTVAQARVQKNKAVETQTRDHQRSVHTILSQHLDDSSKTQVMVLATPHLRILKDCFKPSATDSLLSALRRYRPQLIGIESIPPEEIDAMVKKGGDNAIIVDAFAGKHTSYAAVTQKLIGRSATEAKTEADSILQWSLPTDASTRLNLIVHLLAANDYYSALLQWSYLPQDARTHNNTLPDSISRQMNEALLSPNEIHSLAIVLAKTLRLQRLFSIDDHYDDLMLLPVNETLSEEISKHPLYQEIAQSTLYTNQEAMLRRACQDGNLLPHYKYLNSPEYLLMDVDTQWSFFLRTKLPSGLDRYRLTLWEVRNLNIASNIRKATATHNGGRMLVIIGASHKPFLDNYLNQMGDIKLVNVDELLRNINSSK